VRNSIWQLGARNISPTFSLISKTSPADPTLRSGGALNASPCAARQCGTTIVLEGSISRPNQTRHVSKNTILLIQSLCLELHSDSCNTSWRPYCCRGTTRVCCMMFCIRSLARNEAGVLCEKVDLCALGASRDLPYEIERYFVLQPGAFLVPVRRLITTRRRPRGIAHAARLMRAAWDGQRPRRPPIRVRPYKECSFLIEDGNSTALNAIASAWPDILCIGPNETDTVGG